MNEITDYKIDAGVLTFECAIDAILDTHKAEILSKEYQAVIEESKGLRVKIENLQRQIEEQAARIIEYQKQFESIRQLVMELE